MEFARWGTGEVPARDRSSGELLLTEESAVVLVLLPGGTARVGAQGTDPSAPHYDLWVNGNELSVMEVELEPFLISKYELSQAQWLRLTGGNPSQFHPDPERFHFPLSLLHPVESVTWLDCVRYLARVDLELPREVEWEYAARGGTGTPWFTGEDPSSLIDRANLADLTALREQAQWPSLAQAADWDDGYVVHAPVNELRPNPFGLHQVHGNVWEWCLDDFNGDPERRVYRGGSYSYAAPDLRSACRHSGVPNLAHGSLGLRPAMRLVPGE